MARYAIVLGVLCALGPIAIDMYLPAMPAMAGALHATPGEVQASLMSFFIGMSSGQLLFGPISDAAGRRPPILFGLALFVAAGVVCAIAPNAPVLVAARLAQGLGASVGFGVGTAVIRDIYTGEQAARLFALCILVLGVSPVLAPLAGSLVIATASWRFIFWAAAAGGMAGIVLVLSLLPESHPPEARSKSGVLGALAAYARILGDRRFMGVAMANALAQGGFFAYLAGSSFVLIESYGLSPFMFSLVFGVNAVALIGGAQIAPNLMRRLGPERLIQAASGLLAVAVLVPLAAELLHRDSLAVLLPSLFAAMTAVSQIGTPSMVLALRSYGRGAGTASAVLGSLQIGSGALASGVVAALANGTSTPMVATIAACALAAFALFRVSLRDRSQPVEAAG